MRLSATDFQMCTTVEN